jgi:hypothetical protein
MANTCNNEYEISVKNAKFFAPSKNNLFDLNFLKIDKVFMNVNKSFLSAYVI